MPFTLAHGMLGAWDELLFIPIAIVFTIIMFFGWRLSRKFKPELEEDTAQETILD